MPAIRGACTFVIDFNTRRNKVSRAPARMRFSISMIVGHALCKVNNQSASARPRPDWNEHRGTRAESRAQLLKHLIIVGVIARDCIRYRLYFHSLSLVRANDRYRGQSDRET